MPRPGYGVLWVEVTDDERAAIHRLKNFLGVSSVPNLIRDALWTLADEAGFDLEIARRTRKRDDE